AIFEASTVMILVEQAGGDIAAIPRSESMLRRCVAEASATAEGHHPPVEASTWSNSAWTCPDRPGGGLEAEKDAGLECCAAVVESESDRDRWRRRAKATRCHKDWPGRARR